MAKLGKAYPFDIFRLHSDVAARYPVQGFLLCLRDALSR